MRLLPAALHRIPLSSRGVRHLPSELLGRVVLLVTRKFHWSGALSRHLRRPRLGALLHNPALFTPVRLLPSQLVAASEEECDEAGERHGRDDADDNTRDRAPGQGRARRRGCGLVGARCACDCGRRRVGHGRRVREQRGEVERVRARRWLGRAEDREGAVESVDVDGVEHVDRGAEADVDLAWELRADLPTYGIHESQPSHVAALALVVLLRCGPLMGDHCQPVFQAAPLGISAVTLNGSPVG